MLTAEEKKLFAHLRDDIEQISAAASHDLRDQLRMALQECVALRAECDTRFHERLDRIEHGIMTTMENVAALRQYAYLAQNLERPQELLLEGVFEKARYNCATLCARCNGHIQWRCPPGTVLYARPTQLELMFTQIFANGLQYNRSSAPEVQVTVTDTGHFYECVIEDNGIGMEPEFAFLVFGLFKRIEPEGEVKGCGAGLAFAKKVAENHGGAIALQSESGYGCRVTVTLPHSVAASRAAAEAISAPQPASYNRM